MKQPNIVLGMTGASGAIYAVRLLQVLLEADQHVHLAISPAAQLVIKQELGLSVDLEDFRSDNLLFGADDSPAGGPMAGALAEVLGRSAAARRALGQSLALGKSISSE